MIDLSGRIPYAYQFDSTSTRQGKRMCRSSTMAMLLESCKPGILRNHPDRRGRQFDDFYREVLESLRVGDTTETAAQLATLKHFLPSWRFEFRQNCTWEDVIASLQQGLGVGLGILHHGPVLAPTGDGHWLLACGWVGGMPGQVICHDPAGELDVQGGGYMRSGPTDGKAVRYSSNGLGRRWSVEGPGHGWAMFAHPPK